MNIQENNLLDFQTDGSVETALQIALDNHDTITKQWATPLTATMADLADFSSLNVVCDSIDTHKAQWDDTMAFAYEIIDREVRSRAYNLGLDVDGAAIDYARDVALEKAFEVEVPDGHASPKGYITLTVRGYVNDALGVIRGKAKRDVNPLDTPPVNSSCTTGMIGNSKARLGMASPLVEEWDIAHWNIIKDRRQLSNTKHRMRKARAEKTPAEKQVQREKDALRKRQSRANDIATMRDVPAISMGDIVYPISQ